MFGGLTKTSSRIAIAAALGMTLGGYALHSTPAKAADLGGDCCADLEERVADLEATTVRKGNKKVSVTISGWVVKDMNFWDDGSNHGFFVGDKDITLSSHFTISGQATIAPGWSGGYNMTIEAPGGTNGFFTNQFNFPDINAGCVLSNCLGGNSYIPDVLQSYMFIKSDKYGTLNWGLLSPSTDNVALLPDLSGTIIESNAVLFEGASFLLNASHPTGGTGPRNGLRNGTWGNFTNCDSVSPIGAPIGADCNTALPVNAVRYDSPTFGGFSVSTSYGEQYYWDIAAKYAADWNEFKVSAAFGYTDMLDEDYGLNGLRDSTFASTGATGPGFHKSDDVFEVGASVMHVPSGLWVYGMWQQININGSNEISGIGSSSNDSDTWFVKAGIKRTWIPLGATTVWGEGGQYLDQFAGIAGTNVCSAGGALSPSDSTASVPACADGFALVSGSTVNRFGAGIVQEIDAAAMHVFFHWQDLQLDTDLVNGAGAHTSASFKDLNIFQVGGVIFF